MTVHKSTVDISRGISTLANAFWSSTTLLMVTMAVIVGIGAGLGTIAFVGMISFFQNLFFGYGSRLTFLGAAYVIILPALGGLLVGPLVHFLAPEAKGHGVPEVLAAVHAKGGRIRPIVVLAKAVGSAITIGSGGSVGREGPIVQIGSAIGSTIARVARLGEAQTVNLIAAGAAGGIAATFNAPIAGVMFALEVILAGLNLQAFGTIVVSAVTASVVSRSVLGDSPAFVVPSYAFQNPLELALYLGLGIVAPFAALAFVRVLYFAEDIFDRWTFPPYLKPAVGGLALGALGLFLPRVFGTGFGTITDALTGRVALSMLAILVLGKIVATSLTLGAGFSGGVFAPALFIGAVLGGAYGQLAHLAFPDIAGASGAYAVIGMAAVFAGAARAPITAILIVFEMTQDYHLILPLMFATVVSTLIAGRLEPESIYTLKLVRRGIDVLARRDRNLMRAITVEEAMTPAAEMPLVKRSTTLPELARLFQESGHHGFCVLDDDGDLYGVVTRADLERAADLGNTQVMAGEICTRNVLTVFPDETLDDALSRFGSADMGRLPVVERANPRHVLGILRRSDIVRAYSHLAADAHERAHHMARLRMEAAAGSDLVELGLRAGDSAVGKQLCELALPQECVIISIRRGNRIVVPRGGTRLQAGDRLVALAGAGCAQALRRALQTQGEAES